MTAFMGGSWIRRAVMLGVALLALARPLSATEDKPLGFGLISTQPAGVLAEQWGPIVDDLSSALGRPVRMQFFTDYAGVIHSLQAGEIQLAWTGNKAAILAVDRARSEVFAQKVDLGGSEGYRSYLIVHRHSGLASVAETMARADQLTLGFGDPNSTSGTLVPGYYLFAQQGGDPRRLFKRVLQANHEQNMTAVAERRVDAATVASATYDRVCAARPSVCADHRIIWESPVIPGDPLLWRVELPEDLKSRIRQFFVDYGSEGPEKAAALTGEQRRRLSAIGASRFRPSDDRQLAPIRELETFYSRNRTAAVKSTDTATTR